MDIFFEPKETSIGREVCLLTNGCLNYPSTFYHWSNTHQHNWKVFKILPPNTGGIWWVWNGNCEWFKIQLKFQNRKRSLIHYRRISINIKKRFDKMVPFASFKKTELTKINGEKIVNLFICVCARRKSMLCIFACSTSIREARAMRNVGVWV